MNEEQIEQKFKENYPDYVRGDTLLRPFFDIWENAIETAEKEMGNERMIRTDNTETLANALKRIEELEKENEDLKKQIRGVKVKMTNAQKFINEIAHDILCADSESGSDIVHHLPFEVRGYFDTSYDDESIFSLVKWLQSEYKPKGKGDLTGADLVEIGMLP